jgi:hypothetical protein
MRDPRHFFRGDFVASGRRRLRRGFARARRGRRATNCAGPIRGRVDFREGEIRGEKLADDLFALDDKQPQRLAMLLLAQRTEALDLGLGEHAGSSVRRTRGGKHGARSWSGFALFIAIAVVNLAP